MLQNKRNELQNLKKRKPKIYLVDIGDITYNKDIKIAELENCTTSINYQLKEAISDFNQALEPIKKRRCRSTS